MSEVLEPQLREAHIAGFTRYLATGQRKLLGTTVEVGILHAAGRELAARLQLEEHPAPGDRSVFVAQVELQNLD